MRQARLFFCALGFMTRLPTPRLDGFQPDWIARSSPYYPVVGWIVGAVSSAVLLIASRFWPGLPAAALAVGAGLLATGGFHEDGLADTVDGLGGGQTRARRLEIMKDSRIGSYGALALWTALTIKAAALATLAPLQAALLLILTHGAARAFAVVVMATQRYAGDPDVAKLKPAPMGARPGEAVIAVVLGLAPMVLLPPLQATAGLILGACGATALALIARRLVGGFTGDVLGGVEQLAELGLLLGFAIRGLGA
ncbi:MAG TPA: adenosylcobinamide-GDP ribazoletransferase [Caulobacteraceae bacterium]|jgi:adenosylcobinamide-GDP ribazoletransferase|nr:adenosylcobinamide-GDP ribazoletransferase [Caulobacteraceae bacterium]